MPRLAVGFLWSWSNGGLGIGWYVEWFPYGFYHLDLGPLDITLFVNRRRHDNEC